MEDLFNLGGDRRDLRSRARPGQRPHSGSIQRAEIRDQIVLLVRLPIEGGHRGGLLRNQRAIVSFCEHMELAVVRLQNEVMAALGAGEAVQLRAVLQSNRDLAVARRDVVIRIQQRLLQVGHLKPLGDVG